MGKAFGLAAILVAVVIGVFFWSQQGEQALQTGTDSALEKARDAKDTLEQKGVVSSLQEAMGLGETMRCTYNLDQNGQNYQSEVVLQGKKFRSTTTMGDMTVYALSDETAQYTWTSKDKNGFKLDEACQDALEELGEGVTAEQKIDKGLQNAEQAFDLAKNVSCSPTGTIDLSIPKDITFTDHCAMMKQSMEMMKQMQGKIPGGTGTMPPTPSN